MCVKLVCCEPVKQFSKTIGDTRILNFKLLPFIVYP